MYTVRIPIHTSEVDERYFAKCFFYAWEIRNSVAAYASRMLNALYADRAYRNAREKLMNIAAKRLKAAFPNACYTYGNITHADREAIHLEKSHANDAVAIAKHLDIRFFGDYTIHDCDYTVLYRQVRKKKRSLHEANPRKGRNQPNREAKRNAKNTKRVKNVCLLDKIVYQNSIGIVTGFSNLYCRAVKADGSYLGANAKNK